MELNWTKDIKIELAKKKVLQRLTYRELAETLGCTKQNIHTRIGFAVQFFKVLYGYKTIKSGQDYIKDLEHILTVAFSYEKVIRNFVKLRLSK